MQEQKVLWNDESLPSMLDSFEAFPVALVLVVTFVLLVTLLADFFGIRCGCLVPCRESSLLGTRCSHLMSGRKGYVFATRCGGVMGARRSSLFGTRSSCLVGRYGAVIFLLLGLDVFYVVLVEDFVEPWVVVI
jgi:hypothetical protein